MDREIERLAGKIKNLIDEPDEDEFWKELEDDESKGQSTIINDLVYVLSNGDILKGKKILDRVTMTEALEWWLITIGSNRK